jgi:hypothetical protein
MGPLSRGTRPARPPAFSGLPSSLPLDHGSASPAAVGLGALLGALAGIGVVIAVGALGPEIPLRVRGAVLGALMGVLLAPIVAVASFLLMLISPFSLGGILGDSTWTGLARALHERRIRSLVLPLFVFVGLPMALCGLGGSKMTAITTGQLVAAGLGAALLGTVVGGVCGACASPKDNA